MIPKKPLDQKINDIFFNYFLKSGKNIPDEDRQYLEFVPAQNLTSLEPILLQDVLLHPKYDNYPYIELLKLDLMMAINDELYEDWHNRQKNIKKIIDEELIKQHLKDIGFNDRIKFSKDND